MPNLPCILHDPGVRRGLAHYITMGISRPLIKFTDRVFREIARCRFTMGFAITMSFGLKVHCNSKNSCF